MDYTAVVEVGCFCLTCVGGVFAYLWRRSQAQLDNTMDSHGKQLKSLDTELAAYKLHVAETYVTSNELSKAIDSFNRAIDAVFGKLDRIEDKLDKKADK
jgi:septal ring factor EnvC (AmiA/AmiB activator)